MRAILGAFIGVFLWISGAEAGGREALEAYQRGDYPAAFAACRMAAQQGDPSCQNLLGVLYSQGRGVQKSEAEAATWFRKAAEQGHPQACFNLGRAYQFGRGVKVSDEEALKWYAKAAAQHVPEAEFAIGMLTVERNPREGMKW